ncbi:MAG: 50S ribosomal protein L25 [Planctomycetes bacterium]|nr:50S ribosomal protein L25 [Planctomycetota bacterium]
MAISTETLHAKKREASGTRACRRLRAQGEVPAILYGHKEEAVALQVSVDELEKALRHHARMLELQVDDRKDTVLLRAVQYDALGDEIVHVDFVRVAMDETITLEVPIQLKGKPKVEHAVLQQTLGVLEIECLPANIPDAIIVPAANLILGQSIHVGDIVPPEGIKIVTEPEIIVATLTAAAAEVSIEAAAAEGEATAEPEVIGRKAEPGEEDADDKEK